MSSRRCRLNLSRWHRLKKTTENKQIWSRRRQREVNIVVQIFVSSYVNLLQRKRQISWVLAPPPASRPSAKCSSASSAILLLTSFRNLANPYSGLSARLPEIERLKISRRWGEGVMWPRCEPTSSRRGVSVGRNWFVSERSRSGNPLRSLYKSNLMASDSELNLAGSFKQSLKIWVFIRKVISSLEHFDFISFLSVHFNCSVQKNLSKPLPPSLLPSLLLSRSCEEAARVWAAVRLHQQPAELRVSHPST